MTRKDTIFTITDTCADIQGGGEIIGGPIIVTTSFTMAGVAYRYCGSKVQF